MQKIIHTSQKNSLWNLWVVIVPAIVFGIYIYKKDVSIKQGSYTIGFLTKKYWSIVSHESIVFSYKRGNNEYTSSAVYNENYKPKVGERFLVQYSLKYGFGGVHIFQDIRVPDSIKEAPFVCWKELPIWADKK